MLHIEIPTGSALPVFVPRPYRRERNLLELRKSYWLEIAPLDCMDPAPLVEVHGEEGAICAIARVIRVLWTHVRHERILCEANSWLFRPARHEALLSALNHELDLFRALTAKVVS